MTNNPIFIQIEETIKNNDIVLFMKGTKDVPQCGFSSTVVTVLGKCGVDFKDVNVMADNELREAIKEFSNWATIPQLYIKGEFIGGCDITREMFKNGELQALLQEKNLVAA